MDFVQNLHQRTAMIVFTEDSRRNHSLNLHQIQIMIDLGYYDHHALDCYRYRIRRYSLFSFRLSSIALDWGYFLKRLLHLCRFIIDLGVLLSLF